MKNRVVITYESIADWVTSPVYKRSYLRTELESLDRDIKYIKKLSTEEVVKENHLDTIADRAESFAKDAKKSIRRNDAGQFHANLVHADRLVLYFLLEYRNITNEKVHRLIIRQTAYRDTMENMREKLDARGKNLLGKSRKGSLKTTEWLTIHRIIHNNLEEHHEKTELTNHCPISVFDVLHTLRSPLLLFS